MNNPVKQKHITARILKPGLLILMTILTGFTFSLQAKPGGGPIPGNVISAAQRQDNNGHHDHNGYEDGNEDTDAGEGQAYNDQKIHPDYDHDTATFAAGCFWCVEAQFKELKGVQAVISGFTGGKVPHPTYKEVCTGLTGHAEACNIIYDPSVISFKQLLAAFFVAHDPTSLNRQGADEGTQYRSAIFYHNQQQKQLAEAVIQALNREKAYDKPIVTEVTPYTVFYKAEDYHQNYYDQNKQVPYCQLVIKPKLEKFRAVFKSQLK